MKRRGPAIAKRAPSEAHRLVSSAPAGGTGISAVCALATTRQAARVLTQLYDGYFGAAQIEAAQFALLMTVDGMAGRSQGEIGRAIGMDKTTLSRNLKLLRARGWIGPEGEKRGGGVSLTEAGRERLSEARPAWQRGQAALRAEMREGEWEQVFGAMQAVMRAARKAMEKEN